MSAEYADQAGTDGTSGDAASAGFASIIEQLGGVPILLPPVESPESVRGHVALVDAVVLAGGAEIHPNFTGGVSREGASHDPRRDRYEWQLLDRAIEADLPTLAVDRGLQLLNAFLGGTLLGDIELEWPSPVRHLDPSDPRALRHEIEVEGGTLMARIVGAGALPVNSEHSQGVAQLAEPLVVGARSADGLVEAAEMLGQRFVVGVQYRPERLEATDPAGRPLLAALLQAAAGEAVRGAAQG
jgi:putative glutamine amidotransferase